MDAPAARALDSLPYRGPFGDPRPGALAGLDLPPQAMASHDAGRPLKAWRYIGAYSPELMLCLGVVRVGPLHQSFWAVWDREQHRLDERTVIGRRQVALWPGRAAVASRRVQIELRLEETAGIETVSRSGRSYAWTRKQGGVPVSGRLVIDGRARELRARGVIDDSAGYQARHTSWRWSAGVGRSEDGQAVAWNLVEGVHDAPQASERTVWIDGQPREVAPVTFAPDLGGVGGLRFQAEATRERRDNLILIRSVYRQPFGVFAGALPDGTELQEGYGVMESHDAWW
ncbi:MAG TPA: DUF2804 family protein [Solirubrobacteraceae bacterium]|nr:DUF2804 family protein [Solirubrobacteraceae bacterium]